MKSDFQIDSEALERARRQFCLDTCLEWDRYQESPEKKSYIQRTVYEPGSRFSAFCGARKYWKNDSFFKAIVCMGQLFLAVDDKIYDWAVESFGKCKPEWICEFGTLRKIDEKLREHGRKLTDTHIYFLPRKEKREISLGQWDEGLSCQWYEKEELLLFRRRNRFARALCFSPTQPDVLAVAAIKKFFSESAMEKEVTGAYGDRTEYRDQSSMAGMAGASEDGAYLWQIGIVVAEEYEGRGLGARLVRALKEEVLRRGKIPFYGTSESHTVSQTVALKAGFVPAWTELYAASLTEED